MCLRNLAPLLAALGTVGVVPLLEELQLSWVHYGQGSDLAIMPGCWPRLRSLHLPIETAPMDPSHMSRLLVPFFLGCGSELESLRFTHDGFHSSVAADWGGVTWRALNAIGDEVRQKSGPSVRQGGLRFS